MPTTINPLRYPGAKRQLVPYISRLLESNNLLGSTFYEPYAGSAVVGLELLQKGLINKLILVEKDVLIYSFWKCVFSCAEELCNRIEETSIDIKTWITLKPLRDVKNPHDSNLLDLGFAGLFFNRTNFSGILKANPIGGINQDSSYKIDCRFNKPLLIALIKKLAQLKDRVEIHWDDAINFMNKIKSNFLKEKSFVYFDPPYYSKGEKLYRHFYSSVDHESLANFVRHSKHYDWLISYDDAPYICGLYSGIGAKYCPFYLDYSVSKKQRSTGKELLISNLPLPPVNIYKKLIINN
ncbi:DNA adenine methylase [Brevibacillus borstelensis]|uniref:DNA adenine methylase n=1 Tax=Brevibacillus borstelensis TaxID=45462 RepID=UPI000F084933|nr:DNA adenine methylase [Brevibacillus borstelensis]MED1883094.1 DNA adenine methylase [Brevibacillus borstelensis]RNB65216.1 DNA adenine methylase [Brevibacillus borstelensis]GED53190.1 DNA methyltransferase [Brevibacillus borstelensis]